MPRDIEHFTTCAHDGNAESFSPGVYILAFITLGGLAGLAAYAAVQAAQQPGGGCSPVAWGIVAGIFMGLFFDLVALRDWYYNRRLMCIRNGECAVGTVVGKPVASCDGDRKLDLLLAPFTPREIDGPAVSQAIRTVAAADTTFPPVPSDLEINRVNRLAYMHGLTSAQRKRVYLELVHGIMLDPTINLGRDFQSRYMRREPPPIMPQDAFDHSPLDRPTDPDPNPLFKYDDPGGGEDTGSVAFLCRTVIGFDEPTPEEPRIIPFMHCEIEGNRISATIDALIVTLFAYLLLFSLLCSACIALGLGPVACGIIVPIITLILSILLFWLLRELFGDGTDASDLPVDVPDPTAPDESSSAARGDVVFVYGNWIKDTEHTQYFEIHPVKAWYLVCRDPDNVPTLSDEPGVSRCGFDVTTLTTDEQVTNLAARADLICRAIRKAETEDPMTILRLNTPAALSMAGGIA
jgi:hypothetical protein